MAAISKHRWVELVIPSDIYIYTYYIYIYILYIYITIQHIYMIMYISLYNFFFRFFRYSFFELDDIGTELGWVAWDGKS
jgi:hypothetical protein